MESTIKLEQALGFIPNEKIHPVDLVTMLDYFTGKIKALSLDCFDTLLWRKTAIPVDVFYDLQHKPAFKALKFTPFLRIRLEAQARKLKIIQNKSTEVTLREIYQTGFPALNDKELQQLADEELAAEAEACFAFPPIVQLIRLASARGIKIVIVSNTYFTETQLKNLLAKTLPSDVIPLIHRVFCSCEYGISKVNGLFKRVQSEIGFHSNTILHIGDDLQADLLAAQDSGFHAAQLIQYENNITEMLRLHAASAAVFNPTVRHSQSLAAPFRPLFSHRKLDKPEEMIGYASIGPIMYAFGEFILDEIENLNKAGKKPNVLFLMRDAYLPSLICNVLAEKTIGKRIRISRFSAYAASFRSKDDINKYLAEVVFTGRFQDIARQLLLPNEIIDPLMEVLAHSDNPIGEFLHHIQSEQFQTIILSKSTSYRKKLIKYLQKEADIKPGETVVFVDLGYSGTAQKLLEPILKDELNIELLGRYLIELNIPAWEKSRRGLLDPSWCDDRAMLALVTYIALLEQICTSNEKSVIDYDEEGNPIFSETSFTKNQYHKLEKIQNECLRFAEDAKTFFATIGKPSMSVLRETSLAELGRLIFLPTEKELQYLESFQFDLNLGTHDILQVFDSQQGLKSLKKRGLFFAAMEKNQKTMRTNYPAELRAAGLELVMTLMTQSRFAIELGFKDMSLRREKIPVMAIEQNHCNKITIDALLTYDGFYSLTIPTSDKALHVSIVFGEKYQWLQLESAELITLKSFLNSSESLFAEDCWSALTFNGLENRGGNLYFCHAESSSIIVPPLGKEDNKKYLVRLVFRPIVMRESQSLHQALDM